MFNAQTVLNQIGAQVLAEMGARNFVKDGRQIIFQVGRRRSHLDKVAVSLNIFDTYDIRLVSVDRKTFAVQVVEEIEGVYFDQMSELIPKMVRRLRK